MTKLKIIRYFFCAILFFYFLCIGNTNSFIKENHFDVERNGSDHPDEYAKYHFEIRTKGGEKAPTYKSNYQLEELQKAKVSQKSSYISDVVFTSRGPFNVPGRTRAIAIDPDDETFKTIYAGSVSGGLWRTTDGGGNWQCLTDYLPNLSVSSLVVAPSNHYVLYMGTGEAAYASYSPTGGGIYRSNDKGETWFLLAGTSEDSIRSVARLVVDPDDENVVLASVCSSDLLFYAYDGEYGKSQIIKTVDGGRRWKSVFTSDLDYRRGLVQQLIADPSDFSTIYATQYSKGILKSINKGETWTLYNRGMYGPFGRIELAIANQNSSIIYASVESFTSESGSDLFISMNGGENWILVNDNESAKPWMGSYGYYNNTIVVHPFHDEIVYLGGTEMWKANVWHSTVTASMDMTNMTDYYGRMDKRNTNVHVDHHVLLPILKDDKFFLLNGNDGGVYQSNLSDNPGFEDNTWTKIGDGYNTSQFYSVDKKHGSDSYIGGTQDNGTWWSGEGNAEDEKAKYEHVISGDGFDVVFHYDSTNWVVGSSQYNTFYLTKDNFTTLVPAISGLYGNAPFNSRLCNSKSDPDILFAFTDEGIFRSEDFGLTWSISDMDYSGWEGYRGDFDISLCNNQIIWYAELMYDNNNPYISYNGGINWYPVNNYKSIGYITGVTAHPTNESSAYLLFSVNNEPKILMTEDYGNSWRDISGFDENSESTGFPNVAVFSFLVMPFNTDILWAGTEIGIFESVDNGLSWHIIRDFPSVTVSKMKIIDDQIVIATYGRGIWTAEMPELGDNAPLDFVKPPIIKNLYQDFLSQNHNAKIEFEVRDEYYSLFIKIDDNDPVNVDFANSIGLHKISINLNTGSHKIQFIADNLDILYKSIPKLIEIIVLKDPEKEFLEDFNVPYDNETFSGSLFTARYYSGFIDRPSVHSDHDYDLNTNKYSILTTPLIITEYDSKIRYKDVAIIEPGADGSVFGDNNFFDYVIVEATKNGFDWIPIVDGYDARYDSNWLEAYNNDTRITNQLFIQHEIDLHQYFSLNDTIVVRFRLYSDGYYNAWGWALDDFEFVNSPTGISQEFEYQQFNIYPNPANNFINIQIANDDFQAFNMKIIDLSGRVFIENEILNSRTKLELSALQSGIYILILENPEFQYSKKIIIN